MLERLADTISLNSSVLFLRVKNSIAHDTGQGYFACRNGPCAMEKGVTPTA